MTSKYQRWYDAIIERGKGRSLKCYREAHHIVPRSLGGDDDPANLVDLTYREHFLVHWLLTKIYDGAARQAMVWALHCMTMAQAGRIVAGWQVETSKRALKREVIKRARDRREQLRIARGVIRDKARALVSAANDKASQLNPLRPEDRYRLGGMANELLYAGKQPWRLRLRKPQPTLRIHRNR